MYLPTSPGKSLPRYTSPPMIDAAWSRGRSSRGRPHAERRLGHLALALEALEDRPLVVGARLQNVELFARLLAHVGDPGDVVDGVVRDPVRAAQADGVELLQRAGHPHEGVVVGDEIMSGDPR